MGKKVIRGGLIIKGTLASGSGDDLLTIDATTGEVGKISGTPLTTTLTAGQVFLGNSSNVATATAFSGDVTVDSSGVTAIGSGVIVNADVNASAAIAHSKMAALTASRALVSDGSGVVSVSSVTSTELGYVSGVTSAIQTQLNAKQATVTGAATTIVSSDLTANRALISGSLGKVEVSSVTNTELGYLSGVTSAIQTQFSGKLSATISGAAEGDIIYHNGTNWVNLPRGANGETLQSTGTSIQWASATANGIAAGGTDGQVLTKQSGTDYDADWETLTVAHITEITATAAELNLLDGVTATTTEINYLDGVTSNIQSQFGNKLSTSLPHNAIFVGNISNVAASLSAGSEGQILSISSGTPTWTTISASGVTTIAALDGTTKSANGAAISGVNLYLQTADDTYPGVVSTGTQTFAGEKTFNGNVGVGAAPSFTLDAQSTTTTVKVRAHTSAASEAGFIVERTVNTPTKWELYSPVGSTDLRFYNAGDRFLFSADGKLGVGVTPTAKLHLPAGTATANTAPLKLTTGTALTTPEDGAMEYHSSNLYFTIGSTRYQLNGLIGSTGSTDNAILRANGTGGLTAQGSAVSIDDSGNVGLGLSATAGASRSITATGSASDISLIFTAKGNGTTSFQGDGSASFNCGAGLSVVGSAAATSTVGSSLAIYYRTTGTAATGIGTGIDLITENAAGSDKTGAKIESVSTDITNGSEDFDVVLKLMAGGAIASEKFRFASTGTGTATDWVATSDKRLKSNIERVEGDVIEEIKKIGSLFSKYERSGKTERGFIAQELLEVAPEYVTVPEDPEQMMAVNYAKMTALLFKGFEQLLK